MKLYLLIFISLFFIHCTDAPAGGTDQTPVQESSATTSEAIVPDTQRVAEIESIIKGFGQLLADPTSVKEKIPFPLYSKEDVLRIVRMSDGMAQISFTGTKGDIEFGPVYYLKNDKILFCHSRVWKKTGSPFGQETLMYFDNNENLILAKERRKELEEGKPPLTMSNLPFEPSKRSKNELMDEFNALWLPIKKEAL